MTLDQWIQVGVLLIGIVSFLYPMHRQNQLKANDLRDQVSRLADAAESMWKRQRKFAKRLKGYEEQNRRDHAAQRELTGIANRSRPRGNPRAAAR